ncbi:MAG: FAD/NAD(P)-binding protein [Alkalilacustris sp.]
MDLSQDFGSNEGGSGRHGTIGPRIVVIGGGASGVLMVLHLLRRSATARIVLVEKTDLLGCGVAYGTRDPAHLLNTRVSSMSAYADDPNHFLTWLRAEVDPDACPFSFVSRAIYGQYLAAALATAEGRDRLTCRRGEAVRVSPAQDGVLVRLADGHVLSADHVVLATGHALPQADPGSAVSLPWGQGALPDPHGDVLLVGTGLTMVDQVLSLLAAGHRGRIEAVSRRGLLPQVHADASPAVIAKSDLPLGAPASVLMRWLRARVAVTVSEGGDWRSVVDGLRPHVQRLWQAMDTDARARFLRHACTWWEVHRHRLPPCSAQRLEKTRAEGRLSLRRAAFKGAERRPDGTIEVRLRPVGASSDELRCFDHVVDCRGIRRDPEHHAAPVIRQMLRDGLAHVDPLRLGIVVDAQARVLRPDGTVLPGTHAIGPVSRSAFWEITAIPDIRVQAAWLAGTLIEMEQNSG